MPSHDAAPSAASPDKMTKLEKLEAELRIMTLAAERAEEKLRLMTMAREHEKEEEEERRTRTGTPKLKHKTPATKSTVGGDRTSGIADEEARAWEEAKIERERRRDEASDLRHALTTTSDERTQFKFEPTRAGIATTLTDFIAFLSKKHTACLEWRAMLMAGESVDGAMAIIESDYTLTKVDRFMHASITAVIDKSTKLGTLFTDEERELDSKDQRKASSGFALVARLDGFQAIEELEEAREHIKKVLAKHVLKAGAEEADTKTKINRIRDGQKELPAEMRAVMPLMTMIIDAVPDSITEDISRTFKQRLHQERTEYKKLNGGKEKHTIEELKTIIATRLKIRTRLLVAQVVPTIALANH